LAPRVDPSAVDVPAQWTTPSGAGPGGGAEVLRQVAVRHEVLGSHLNERQRRLALAVEARLLGHGGVRAVARVAGMSETTVRAGVFELERAEDRPEPVVTADDHGSPSVLLLVRWSALRRVTAMASPDGTPAVAVGQQRLWSDVTALTGIPVRTSHPALLHACSGLLVRRWRTRCNPGDGFATADTGRVASART